jgi:hypothetical protein
MERTSTRGPTARAYDGRPPNSPAAEKRRSRSAWRPASAASWRHRAVARDAVCTATPQNRRESRSTPTRLSLRTTSRSATRPAGPKVAHTHGLGTALGLDGMEPEPVAVAIACREQHGRAGTSSAWLLCRTTTSSHDAAPGAITTRDCPSWRRIARGIVCASMQERPGAPRADPALPLIARSGRPPTAALMAAVRAIRHPRSPTTSPRRAGRSGPYERCCSRAYRYPDPR